MEESRTHTDCAMHLVKFSLLVLIFNSSIISAYKMSLFSMSRPFYAIRTSPIAERVPKNMSLLPIFCLLATAYAATPSQVAEGKVAGPLHPIHTGDYFLDTRCECTSDSASVEEIGHVYQWEYYNRHLNATYLLSSEFGVNHDTALRGKCRIFEQKNDVHTDKYCVMPALDVFYRTLYYELHWNHQRRDLSPSSTDQGYTWTSDSTVNGEICPDLCGDFMRDQRIASNASGSGGQLWWRDVDDM